MQSLTWYVQRLRRMPPGEIAWRARSAVRDAVDRCRFALGRYSSPIGALCPNANSEAEPPFRVSDIRVGEWASQELEEAESTWCKGLLHQADQIARHQFSFFNLQDCDLGDPIDWNRDHANGKEAPLRFGASIDYRDYQVTGDAKVVWEPNRHHQLVVLGRAYRVSGDVRYASAVVEQMESWLRQCPFGMGMNWRSPLELAIRLINWVWAIDLIRDSGFYTGEFRSKLLHAVYLHVWEITRKYSRGSAANNHRIGEAVGVFIATTYFPQLPNAIRWRDESREILHQEMMAQTYPDGGGREQALGYHLFILEFFLLAGITARHVGDDFSAAYWARFQRMLEFAGALIEGGGAPPTFGDCDDGYVLNLGSTRGDVQSLLCVGAILFGRSDFKTLAGRYLEPARWLLGRSSRAHFDAIAPARAKETLASRAFPDSGFYLLQCGRRGAADRMSVLFDCGELGFQSIAAHGHADALSFTLHAFGFAVFVDPGTYDYFSYPAWREYFRSTRAHNTVGVDDADQSTMLGPFLWGARARARCIEWEPRSQGGKVVGEHDGYSRLTDPVFHRRTLDLAGESRTLTIQDEILARGQHEAKIYFHLSEDCKVSAARSNSYKIRVQGRTVTLQLDPRLSVTILAASEDPIGGWISRGYHRKTPSTTLIGCATCHGNTSFVSRVTINVPSQTEELHLPNK